MQTRPTSHDRDGLTPSIRGFPLVHCLNPATLRRLVSLQKEIERRRTFAIISHPDAGKTTLTEKLLLYGGAVHLAVFMKWRHGSDDAAQNRI